MPNFEPLIMIPSNDYINDKHGHPDLAVPSV